MSKNLIPTVFRTHMARQFKESITEPANTIYYAFAGKHSPYANGSIPQPTDDLQTTLYGAFDEMVFGKRILDTDVSLMVPKEEWQTNTVYAAYDSASVIYGNSFYVAINASSQYDVFKCLDNNKGSYSIYAPSLSETSASDDAYSTADGYVWKYMYSVTAATWNKFTTDAWMPVANNANVTGNAVSGSIDIINVKLGGSHYDATLTGQFSAADITIAGDPLLYVIGSNANTTDNFYNDSAIYITGGSGMGQIRKIVGYNGSYRRISVNNAFTTQLSNTSTYAISPLIQISGDGDGAVARALVNTATAAANSIYKVEVVNRGSNYSYATLSIGGNTSGFSNAASLTVSIAPPSGHGFDPAEELGSTAVGISVSFANNESGKISSANDIRTIGILKDPKYANVQFSINSSSLSGTFTVGETITQNTTNATAVVVSINGLTLDTSNATGDFVAGQYISGGSSGAYANVNSYEVNGSSKDFSTFDQTSRYVVNYISGTFQQDEPVYQNTAALANGFFHSNTSTYLNLTNVRGVMNAGEPIVGNTSGASANVISYLPPDLVKNVGDVIYIENIDPVSRSNTQTEKIKLVLKF